MTVDPNVRREIRYSLPFLLEGLSGDFRDRARVTQLNHFGRQAALLMGVEPKVVSAQEDLKLYHPENRVSLFIPSIAYKDGDGMDCAVLDHFEGVLRVDHHTVF